MKIAKNYDACVPFIQERQEFRTVKDGGIIRLSGSSEAVNTWTSGNLPREWLSSFLQASYAVRSYNTPIAWYVDRPLDFHDVNMTEEWLAGSTAVGHWVMPAIRYSNTTGRHQRLVRDAIVHPIWESTSWGAYRPVYESRADVELHYDTTPSQEFDRVPSGGWG